ncbi:hypothetical protein CLV92_115112 [Kineococcus xinjiangensis]|uniref:Uncharacterized protein n=1 Tax=Kineococcus xinjiangensis TaxID=512762 RepID=A0A2S6IDU7_9ACTN|nr:hypothetical protein CLV92_115112 [Kineococcus xinjiangensis]
MSLAEGQWSAVVEGHLTSPSGVRFVRRSSRIKRRDADAMIAAGTPLVLYYYGGAQLDYCDGAEAVERWKAVRDALVSQDPRPRGDVVWTGGCWVSEGGEELLLLTGRC